MSLRLRQKIANQRSALCFAAVSGRPLRAYSEDRAVLLLKTDAAMPIQPMPRWPATHTRLRSGDY
jgi:hypothetical protein